MITIPEFLWDRMLDEFSKDERVVEQVCYFDGVRLNDHGVVVTLTIPNGHLFRDHFEVSPDAMSEAGRHFRQYQMVRLAQVHTHPGSWVGHSPWDDQRAYSQMAGAISIVLPDHARNRPSLAEAGVHLRTKQGWQEMERHAVEQHVRILPSILDFRPKRRTDERANLRPTRRPAWWSILTFWRHQ